MNTDHGIEFERIRILLVDDEDHFRQTLNISATRSVRLSRFTPPRLYGGSTLQVFLSGR
jgi:hypothetical protein